MRYLSQLFLFNSFPLRLQELRIGQWCRIRWRNFRASLIRVQRLGLWGGMSLQEKNKLAIFNFLNFIQLCTGILLPLIAFTTTGSVSPAAWIIAFLPPVVSAVVLVLNARRLYNTALLVYFICYPFCTCLAYLNGIDLGIELLFVMYGILSVFFIQDRSYMVFSIGFSMISYFVLAVLLSRYPFQLKEVNFLAYLLNQAIAIIYIFYGLYLVKSENAKYNATLQQANRAMQQQAVQLQQQAEELRELNALKSKLFSVISHDLKAPMYALRNLFENIQEQDMPGREIKAMVPDIKKDLNDTVSLMENLLQWAKSQMQVQQAHFTGVPLHKMIDDIVNLLHLQAQMKKIQVHVKLEPPVYVWADADMIHLVLRNLLSNAIKFTPPGGAITLDAELNDGEVLVSVADSGAGIEPGALAKIEAGEFHSSYGTSQEQGTGIGLLLCREFLARNESRLEIETATGAGSRFSFRLRKPEDNVTMC